MPPAERFQHGARARYVTGCRCAPCRAANTAYQRTRARAKVYGRTNKAQPVDRVLKHLERLRHAGLGYRTISDAAKVCEATVQKILRGQKRLVRESTAARLLAVTADALADSALVDARPTWRLLQQLLGEGFTRTELARRLGSRGKRPSLQIRPDRVEAATAAKVERLRRSLMF